MSELVIIITLFIGGLLALVALGVPVAVAVGFTSLFMLVTPYGPGLNLNVIGAQFFHGMNSFVFLAFPFYLLLGRLMNRIGLTDTIFDFATAIVGQFKGGIAYVNIIASIIFSGMSGLVAADVAGLGRIEYKAMIDRDYPRDMALGITGSSAVVGPIMPPSVPVIVFAVLAQVSVGAMFLAGIVPALLIGLCIAIFVWFQIRSRGGFEPERAFSISYLYETSKKAVPALMIPGIVIGGIIAGVFTATEAGAVALFYAVLLGAVSGNLTTPIMVQEIRDSMVETFSITFIIANAAVYSYVAVTLGLPVAMADFVTNFTTNETLIIVLLVLIFFILGTFLDKISAIALLVPVLAPTVETLQMDPIHFGIVMVTALMIGTLTPPVGGAIYALEKVTDASLEEIMRAVLPYFIPLIAVLALMIAFPDLVMYLPDTFYGE